MPLWHFLCPGRQRKQSALFGMPRVYHEHTPASASAYNPYGLFVRVRDSLAEFIKGWWKFIEWNYSRSGQRESEYTVLKQQTSKSDKFNKPTELINQADAFIERISRNNCGAQTRSYD